MASQFPALLLSPSLRGLTLLLAAATVLSSPLAAAPQRPREPARHGRSFFIQQMPATIRADHPEIAPVAEAIRAVSLDPLEQLALVHHVTRLLVDYDSDQRVYGRTEYHATLDEMIEHRDERKWPRLRDDCDGRAVFAAHLLAALDIPWRLEASYFKRHAWVSARIGGHRFDLLDLDEPDAELEIPVYQRIGRQLTRNSRPPPEFGWRRAWLDRTGGNMETGLRLGLLGRSSRDGRLQERFAVNWTRRDPDRGDSARLAETAASRDDESSG